MAHNKPQKQLFGHICTEICSAFFGAVTSKRHILNWPFCEQNDITKWVFHWEPSKFGKSNCPKHVCIAILNYWFRDVLNTCGQHTQNPFYIIFIVNFPRGFDPPARFPRATFQISIRWYTYTYPMLHDSQHHHSEATPKCLTLSTRTGMNQVPFAL